MNIKIDTYIIYTVYPQLRYLFIHAKQFDNILPSYKPAFIY